MNVECVFVEDDASVTQYVSEHSLLSVSWFFNSLFLVWLDVTITLWEKFHLLTINILFLGPRTLLLCGLRVLGCMCWCIGVPLMSLPEYLWGLTYRLIRPCLKSQSQREHGFPFLKQQVHFYLFIIVYHHIFYISIKNSIHFLCRFTSTRRFFFHFLHVC